MRKNDTVFYTAHQGAGSKVRARVEHVHRDGSATVTALFFVGENGEDRPGYIGFDYRLDQSDLRQSA